jgi:methyl-accepting chemotaxis protein
MTVTMKLQTKLLIMILGIFVAVFASVIAYVIQTTNNTAIKDARQLSEAEAMVNANEIKAILEVGMDTARTLAFSFEGLDQSGKLDRDAANGILLAVLENNSDLIGAWTCWEPGAFDDQDEVYTNTLGHDATGRFVPYWFRDASGEIIVVPLEFYEQSGDGDYYQLALNTGKEVLLEPYDYPVGNEIISITTMSVPIFRGSTVVGVVGVDMSLTKLEEIANAVQLFDTGYARIISHDGIVVTHPDPTKAGVLADELAAENEQAEEAWMAIKEGLIISQTTYSPEIKDNLFTSLVPIQVGYSDAPWSLGTVIPEREILAESKRLSTIIITVGGLGLLLVCLALLFITKPIVRNVKDSTSFIVDLLAKGNFSVDVPDYTLKLKDEFGDLARGLAATTVSLRGLISQTVELSTGVNSGSESVSAASEEMSSSLEELSASTNEFASNAQSLSENSQTMAETNARILSRAEEGNQAIEEAVNQMQVINNRVSELQVVITEVDQRSNDIGKILGVITDIADQTNLLALNAAIEAARAGEQGRGFAVVAEEVRKLAEQSARAAKEIGELITATQAESQKALESMTLGVKDVEMGTEVVSRTGITFAEILDDVKGISKQVEETASAAQELSAGSEEMAASIEEQSSTMEEMAATAEELRASAERLFQELQKFKYQ